MSSPSASVSWWQSFAQRGGAGRGDVAGGLTAAIVLLAIEGSYGLIAYSFVGPAGAQFGFVIGVTTGAVASMFSAVGGARGPLLTGSSAALALLVPSMLGVLAFDPRLAGLDAQVLLPIIAGFAALGLVLGGCLQIVLAILRLGVLVRYVPYPVHAGFMNGVAVLMVLAMLPHLLGLPFGTRLALDAVRPLALAVGVLAVVIAVKPPRFTRPVPGYLTALIVATVAHHLLALTPASAYLGPLFDPPEFALPGVDALAPLAGPVFADLLRDRFWLLANFALAVAFVSTLQTAMAGSVIDGLTRIRRDRGRELLSQGVANVAVGLTGGLPTAGAVSRSKVNIDAGATTAMSRVVYGVALIALMAIAMPLFRYVPMAAIAGVFIAVAFTLVDTWTRRATVRMWQQAVQRRISRALLQSYLVMLLVAAVAVFVSLPAGIGAGLAIAILLFIRSNIKQPIRTIVHGAQRTSRKVRPEVEADWLRQHGNRIVLIELNGALFFGTAETAAEQIERLVPVCEHIILDFEHVSEVDASGARVLLLAADAVKLGGKRLLFAGLGPRDSRTRMIRDMDVSAVLSDEQFFRDADQALEAAEEAVLAGARRAGSAAHALSLQAALGPGFDADDLQLLSTMLIERRFARGDVVFRRGDPSDAMYLLLSGQIGIRISADVDPDLRANRRLVSYAPGVLFGEMGMITGANRSADAVAESDSTVLELSRGDFERLKAEHPALAAKILMNISVLLAARVRSLSDELAAPRGAG